MTARRGRDRSLRAKGLQVLLLPIVMLVLAAGVFYATHVQTVSYQQEVTKTRITRDQLQVVRELLVDGETGIRGFLATGDRSFLEPTTLADKQLPEALNRLGEMVEGDPVQTRRMRQVREVGLGYQMTTVDPELPAAASLADRQDPQEFDERSEWLQAQKRSTDEIRRLLSAMSATEDALLAEHLERRDMWQDWAKLGVGLALAIGVAGGLAAMAGFTRGVARRVERLRQDADRFQRGEPLDAVDPRADELGVLSRALHEAVERQRAMELEAQEARRAAEHANHAKSEFLSRMSHELRTPLNAVLGFAQLLEMDAAPEQQESLRQIRTAGRHLLNLINEVLDISAIEAGELPLSPEPVLVSELVGESVDLMRPLAAANSVTIEVTGSVCGQHVRGDRQRIKQVLLNLLSNAVKYSRDNGNVSVRCCTEELDMLRIEVEDDGIGIAAADLSRLFTPFERLGAGRTDIEGTGVGLALSLRLAEAMSGRLEVSSVHGQGSTFSLVLPLATDPTAGARAAQMQEDRAPHPAAQAPERTFTLLCIEDNMTNVRLLEQIVSRRGEWRLVHAGHGHLGMELARSTSPDLILLDLHLPDMPGTDVLRRLKADDATARLPLIVVTADATPGQNSRLVESGADAYLTKPVDVEDLLGHLDGIAATALAAHRG